MRGRHVASGAARAVVHQHAQRRDLFPHVVGASPRRRRAAGAGYARSRARRRSSCARARTIVERLAHLGRAARSAGPGARARVDRRCTRQATRWSRRSRGEPPRRRGVRARLRSVRARPPPREGGATPGRVSSRSRGRAAPGKRASTVAARDQISRHAAHRRGRAVHALGASRGRARRRDPEVRVREAPSPHPRGHVGTPPLRLAATR